MKAEILNHPPGYGWYWWRQHEFDTWKVVKVCDDHGALYCHTEDDMNYQCGDDPKTPFTGQWWTVRLEPPPE